MNRPSTRDSTLRWIRYSNQVEQENEELKSQVGRQFIRLTERGTDIEQLQQEIKELKTELYGLEEYFKGPDINHPE